MSVELNKQNIKLTSFARPKLVSLEFVSKLKVRLVAPHGLLSMPRILRGLRRQCVELADLIRVINSSPESLERSCEQSSAGFGGDEEKVSYLISKLI